MAHERTVNLTLRVHIFVGIIGPANRPVGCGLIPELSEIPLDVEVGDNTLTVSELSLSGILKYLCLERRRKSLSLPLV